MMAQSLPLLGRTTLEGSDEIPDHYCEPCHEVNHKTKPVEGYCYNCDENLCWECFTSHHGPKLFRTHKLVNKSARKKMQPSLRAWLKNAFYIKVKEIIFTVAVVLVALVLTLFINLHSEDKSTLVKTENVATSCDIIIEQINKMTAQLETIKENNKNESLFIAMKLAEHQLQSQEEKLNKLVKDNSIREDKTELGEQVKINTNYLDELEHLSCLRSPSVSKSDQKAKRPTHVKDITVPCSGAKECILWQIVMLFNDQILTTDIVNQKMKILDTSQEKVISEIQLSGQPIYATKVDEDEVAVTVIGSTNTIQFISISNNAMSKTREFTVDGECNTIAYNNRDNTLFVSFLDSSKVKVLDMKGTELKSIEHDSKGHPFLIALTPDMTYIYIADDFDNSLTLMSLNGKVKAVYRDITDRLSGASVVYVHTSSLVYVVGRWSNTVHELDPETGEFKVLLEEKDGLRYPWSITYCDLDDTMYIGMAEDNVIKVYQMK